MEKCEICKKEHETLMFYSGKLEVKSHDFHDWITDVICKECAKEAGLSIIECHHCKREFTEQNHNGRRINENYYCYYCLKELFTKCHSCYEYEKRENLTEFRGGWFHETCLENRREHMTEWESEPLNLENNKFKKLKHKRCFGIEVEIDDDDLPLYELQETCFASRNDGSLENGKEFVSPILQGDKGYEAIKEFCKITKFCKHNTRGSVHLHIDARDLSWVKIKKYG